MKVSYGPFVDVEACDPTVWFVRIVVIGSFFIGRPTLSEAAIECFKLQFEMRAIGFYDGKDSKVRWLAGCRCLVWEGWMETSPCPVFSFQ